MSIGTFGNTMDAKGGKMFLSNSDSESDSDVDEEDEMAKLMKTREESEALPIRSTTDVKVHQNIHHNTMLTSILYRKGKEGNSFLRLLS